MNIPRDKIIHAAGGAIVAAGCGVLAWAALTAGLSPLQVAVLAAGLAGAVSVEVAQWSANRAAVAAGQPVRHEVSLQDAAASFAPAIALAAAIEVVSRFL